MDQEVIAQDGNLQGAKYAPITQISSHVDNMNDGLPNLPKENDTADDLRRQVPKRRGPRHKRIIGMEIQLHTETDKSNGVQHVVECNEIKHEKIGKNISSSDIMADIPPMKETRKGNDDNNMDELDTGRRKQILGMPSQQKKQQQAQEEQGFQVKTDGRNKDPGVMEEENITPKEADSSFNQADTPAFMKMASIVSDESEIEQSPHVCFSIAKELQKLPNIASLEQESLSNLTPALSTFISYGAEDEETLAANRKGFSRYALRARVLTDVSQTDCSTTILNGKVQLAFPICVGPFTGAKAVHPGGEIAVAQAASDAGIIYTIPHYSGYPIEGIRSAMNDNEIPFFFQFYPYKPTNQSGEGAGLQREYIREALPHLSQMKCSAVILTCDTANNGNREKTYKNAQWIAEMKTFPNQPSLRNISNLPSPGSQGHSAAFTWKDVRWMKGECSKYGIALILKGIMTAEDTALAVKAGVDAVLVSNHGGRQLDGTLGSIEVVEECVRAAKGKLEVYMDGGVRRGKDIVKALALGAKCVFIGRPAIWGLGAGGKQGVDRALEILEEEYTTVMQLCGCTKTSELSRDHVEDREGTPRQERPVRWLVAASALCAGAAVVACRSRR